jgi:hypothetical protein
MAGSLCNFDIMIYRFVGHFMADFVEKVGAQIGCNSNETLFAEVRTA